MTRLLAALALTATLGCRGEPDACSEDRPCGFGETCVDGACEAKACVTSSQCGMEQYCDDGDCRAGCEVDGDCYPGDACDSELRTCGPAVCRESKLDCDYKEFCDTASGDCYEASGYYCRACVTDEDCGGNGNLCLGWGVNGDFCGVTCTRESDCPSGFTCLAVTDDAGNPLASQCITYCWLYEDDDGAPKRDACPVVDP